MRAGAVQSEICYNLDLDPWAQGILVFGSTRNSYDQTANLLQYKHNSGMEKQNE